MMMMMMDEGGKGCRSSQRGVWHQTDPFYKLVNANMLITMIHTACMSTRNPAHASGLKPVSLLFPLSCASSNSFKKYLNQFRYHFQTKSLGITICAPQRGFFWAAFLNVKVNKIIIIIINIIIMRVTATNVNFFFFCGSLLRGVL